MLRRRFSLRHCLALTRYTPVLYQYLLPILRTKLGCLPHVFCTQHKLVPPVHCSSLVMPRLEIGRVKPWGCQPVINPSRVVCVLPYGVMGTARPCEVWLVICCAGTELDCQDDRPQKKPSFQPTVSIRDRRDPGILLDEQVAQRRSKNCLRENVFSDGRSRR